MADGGKRFCLNSPPYEGVWKWFYQAAEDIEWRAVGLTHVEYPAGYCIYFESNLFTDNIKSYHISHKIENDYQ